ncbi:MAG TPA: NAD(P)-dependent oxidoreductase [Casimicrobiaceae bacterium]|jgi:UDP-glucose 4-epimerase|nr:NAD(P)-dependent oxidoreductase [Casimicrobiaceae bacterium]
MRVLVTGGCGFVGTAFTRRARREGHEVVTLDRDRTADIVADIGDAGAVARHVASVGPETVVHLAASLTDAAADDPVHAVRVNALGTAAVFAAAQAAGAQRVVYASSNASVGRCAPGSGDDVALEPQTIYGVTKAFGEQLARAMSRRERAPAYLALRFGWIYGPGRARGWSEPQRAIASAIAGEAVVRYPDYARAIDWTYVDDASTTLVRALDCPLDRFAVHNAMGDRRTMRDAIAHLRLRFPGLEAQPYDATLPDSAWDLVNDGLAERLGTMTFTPLETGIDRMIAEMQ